MLLYFWHYKSSALEARLLKYFFWRKDLLTEMFGILGEFAFRFVFAGFFRLSNLMPPPSSICSFLFLAGICCFKRGYFGSHSRHVLVSLLHPVLALFRNASASASAFFLFHTREGVDGFLHCSWVGGKHEVRHKLWGLPDVSLKLTWYQIKSFAVISHTLSEIGFLNTLDMLPYTIVPLSASSSYCKCFFHFSGPYWNVVGFLHMILKKYFIIVDGFLYPTPSHTFDAQNCSFNDFLKSFLSPVV